MFRLGRDRLRLGSEIPGRDGSLNPWMPRSRSMLKLGSFRIGRDRLRLGSDIEKLKLMPRSGMSRLKLGRRSIGRDRLRLGSRIENGKAKLQRDMPRRRCWGLG